MASADGSVKLENHSDSDSASSISEDEIVDFNASNMTFKYNMQDFELKYSGNPEDDLESFITKFKNYAALRDYNADKSALAITTKIVGHASIFLDSVADSDKDTVQKIYDLLKENFEGDSWRWGVESKLLSRKQLPNETLDSYASDIIRWCRQIGKTDAEQMSIFVRGLLPSLRGFVFSKEPKTFRNALDAARLGIAVQQTADDDTPSTKTVDSVNTDSDNSTLDSVVNAVSNLVTRLEKLEDDSKKSKKVSFANSNQNHGATNRSSKRNMICYRCGRVGHGWRKCYAKYGVDGKPLN